MLLLVHTTTLLLFPAAAAWAWRRGQSRALWTVTAGVLAAGLALALFAASEVGGNRLSSTLGYKYVATRIVRLVTLVWVLPVAASAVAIQATASRVRSDLLFPIAVGVGLVAAAGGMIVAIYSTM